MQAGLLRPRRAGGFTLIEMMTALAIVVVLVGLTLGALSQLQSPLPYGGSRSSSGRSAPFAASARLPQRMTRSTRGAMPH